MTCSRFWSGKSGWQDGIGAGDGLQGHRRGVVGQHDLYTNASHVAEEQKRVGHGFTIGTKQRHQTARLQRALLDSRVACCLAGAQGKSEQGVGICLVKGAPEQGVRRKLVRKLLRDGGSIMQTALRHEANTDAGLGNGRPWDILCVRVKHDQRVGRHKRWNVCTT